MGYGLNRQPDVVIENVGPILSLAYRKDGQVFAVGTRRPARSGLAGRPCDQTVAGPLLARRPGLVVSRSALTGKRCSPESRRASRVLGRGDAKEKAGATAP